MPYLAIFGLTEISEIRGLQHHGRSQFFQMLSDEMLQALVQVAQAVMSPETVIALRVLGVAMSQVTTEATAFAHRAKHGMVLVTHFGPLSADTASLNDCTQRVFQALSPYADGAYVGFLMDEGEQRIHEAYPPTIYARLVALKHQYDPTNLFYLNQNIKPTLAPASCGVAF